MVRVLQPAKLEEASTFHRASVFTGIPEYLESVFVFVSIWNNKSLTTCGYFALLFGVALLMVITMKIKQ